MEREKLLDKVRKLQGLAQSPNLQEAEAAAAMVQRLIEQYHIAVAEVEVAGGETEEQEIGTEVLDSGGTNVSNWRASLAGIVARANRCDIFIQRPDRWSARYRGATARTMVVGTPDDVGVAREVFQHLAATVDCLAVRYCAEHRGGGKRTGNSFRWGAVSALRERLAEARREAREGVASTALVRVDRDAERVKDVMANLHLRAARRVATGIDGHAHAAGRSAGSSMSLVPTKQVGQGARLALQG